LRFLRSDRSFTDISTAQNPRRASARAAALTGFGNRNEDGDGFELMP